ncbi:hypothetical protein NOV72_02963 [Caballeronia novacaledonica]|uniref:Uncharacterized protein n=1 Tax=Caballeronia novacaledonica TaxID=1544861 RepID=A0A2U3I6I1_9BURK|nr:hypothetical protein NOV72_02963 [Caballeronia novacaledonica]
MFDEAGQKDDGRRASPAHDSVVPLMDATDVYVRCGKAVAAV